ncbi:unnamed protein product [Sphenostylis stenocarpa]|uniref:Uncharacterized protein n=1 Tax=Sphenostylis stenocarpa TaxID=92480 RepID=A0AA87B7C7_9FABA|nr:unnamed protein product [Sphenostylis stenocarpa]
MMIRPNQKKPPKTSSTGAFKRKRSQWDSNPRPLDPESNAISTPLCDRYMKVMK